MYSVLEVFLLNDTLIVQ